MTSGQAIADRWMRQAAADEIDWASVYEDQLPRIYNYFRFRLGGEADVEDLTALTFEKAWRARSRYRRDLAGFSNWLYTIARRVQLDHVRARRCDLPLDAVLETAAVGTPLEDAERDSDIERLGKLTARLSEREQELIALKFGASLTNRDIARLTGLSESNVGTILHRCVQLLRAQWQAPGETP